VEAIRYQLLRTGRRDIDLFSIYIAVAAFVFVKVLGADVIGPGWGEVMATTTTTPVSRMRRLSSAARYRCRRLARISRMSASRSSSYMLARSNWMIVSACAGQRPVRTTLHPTAVLDESYVAAFRPAQRLRPRFAETASSSPHDDDLVLLVGTMCAYALARLDSGSRHPRSR